MARIRTVKPDFFRHEGLQELEEKHPRLMLFFAGLWCQCDKAGHFRWKPKQIKLDVLPFIEYDPSTYLEVLEVNGYLSRYSADGEDYGEVANFKKHQLIWGSESQSPVRWPNREKEVLEYNEGSTKDIGVRSQELGVRSQDFVADRDISGFKLAFEEARKAYPGSKRGLDAEWADFRKKHGKSIPEIIPLLAPAIRKGVRYRSELERVGAKFIPQWKNLKTWLNQSCWTDEFPTEVYT